MYRKVFAGWGESWSVSLRCQKWQKLSTIGTYLPNKAVQENPWNKQQNILETGFKLSILIAAFIFVHAAFPSFCALQQELELRCNVEFAKNWDSVQLYVYKVMAYLVNKNFKQTEYMVICKRDNSRCEEQIGDIRIKQI